MARRSTCELESSPKGTRVMTFRGSEFGGCTHSHIACLRGLEQRSIDDKVRAIFDAGNQSEEAQKALLVSAGVVLLESATGWENQQTLTLWDGPRGDRGVVLKISPDGLMQLEDDDELPWPDNIMVLTSDGLECANGVFALENKALGATSFGKAKNHGLKAFPSYAWQCSAACHGYRRREKRDDIGVAFMAQLRGPDNLLDGDQFVLWLYDEPPFSEKEIFDKLWGIFDAYDAGVWPECKEYFCRYPKTRNVDCPGALGGVLRNLFEHQNIVAALSAEAESLLIGNVLPIASNGFVINRVHDAGQRLHVSRG